MMGTKAARIRSNESGRHKQGDQHTTTGDQEEPLVPREETQVVPLQSVHGIPTNEREE